MQHNGIELEAMTYNGQEVEVWIHNGVEVWESFNGNLVLTDASDWTTSIDSEQYWASIESFTTNPILLKVNSTADAVAGRGYATCNIPIELSKYSSVTLKGKGMTRDAQYNVGAIIDEDGNEIVSLFSFTDEGYGVAIDKTVDLTSYSQIGYVQISVGVKKVRSGMYVQLDTFQFNK